MWREKAGRWGFTVVHVATFWLAAVVFAGLTGVSEQGEWWQWSLMMTGVLAVEAVFAWIDKKRGWKLAVSLAQAAAVLMLVAAYTMLPAQIEPIDALWPVLLVLAGLVLASAFEPVPAIAVWLLAGTTLASLTGDGLSLYFMSPFVGTDEVQGVIYIATLVLGYVSLGAFIFYVRRVLAERGSARRTLGRLAVAVGALLLATVLAGSFLWMVTLRDAQWVEEQASMAMWKTAAIAGRELQSRFTPSELETAGPEVTKLLLDFSEASRGGITLYDTTAKRVVVAIRDVPLPETPDGPVSEWRSVAISATETALIDRITAGAPIAYPQVGWTAVYDDGERFAIVATPWDPQWYASDLATSDGDATYLMAQVFPSVFAAMLLLVSIALLAFDARDRALRRLLAAQERARLSRDAHDRVYNRMTALANGLEADGPESGAAGSATEVRGALRDLQRILGDVDVRAVAAAEPATELLDDTVADQSARWNMQLTLEGRETLAGLDPRLAWDVQCVVEEALTNSGRHGHATAATVTLARDGRRVVIQVADNGEGLSTPLAPNGLPTNASGLRGMAERVAALGGALRVTSAATGVTVRAEVPI